MPRIRTIKPEFPQSEKIGKLSREARLLFLQLFTLVDDAGRTRAAPRMLASLLYPYDEDAGEMIETWLDEIDRQGLVQRYEVDGTRYLAICRWTEHQKIDRATPSRLPPPPGEESTRPREPSRALAPDLDVDQDQDVDSDSDRASPAGDAPARGCEDSAFDEFWRAYPRRSGANPREPARRKFCELVQAGVDPARMIAAAKRLAAELSASDTLGTRFVPQALTYLAQQRFADEAAVTDDAPVEFDIAEAVKLFARTSYWSRHAGPAPGLPGCRASPDLLARHGFSPDGRRLDTSSSSSSSAAGASP